jgi:hypothetical protein
MMMAAPLSSSCDAAVGLRHLLVVGFVFPPISLFLNPLDVTGGVGTHSEECADVGGAKKTTDTTYDGVPRCNSPQQAPTTSQEQ